MTKVADPEFKKLFDEYVKCLQDKRRKPKDEQICELLELYYTMTQGSKETVADFAHGVYHDLEKLVSKIHSDLELIYAFVIKLREDISREIFHEILLTRDYKV